MVFFNYALRKLNAKIVYYGPGLCGKTTNLQWIHDHFEGGQRGKMISLSTEGDRTIFFDLLPLEIGTIRGMEVTLQLYTVPGQVHYNSTRQLVLRGADGVVFVADSQRTMHESNIDSLKNLQENLMLQGVDLRGFPHVLQFNKRDLSDLITVEELDRELNLNSVPFFEATATEGVGVQETLEGIVKLVMRSLRERYEPVVAPGAKPAVASPAPYAGPTPARPAAPPTGPALAPPTGPALAPPAAPGAPPPVEPVTPPPAASSAPSTPPVAPPDVATPSTGPPTPTPGSPFDFGTGEDNVATGVYSVDRQEEMGGSDAALPPTAFGSQPEQATSPPPVDLPSGLSDEPTKVREIPGVEDLPPMPPIAGPPETPPPKTQPGVSMPFADEDTDTGTPVPGADGFGLSSPEDADFAFGQTPEQPVAPPEAAAVPPPQAGAEAPIRPPMRPAAPPPQAAAEAPIRPPMRPAAPPPQAESDQPIMAPTPPVAEPPQAAPKPPVITHEEHPDPFAPSAGEDIASSPLAGTDFPPVGPDDLSAAGFDDGSGEQEIAPSMASDFDVGPDETDTVVPKPISGGTVDDLVASVLGNTIPAAIAGGPGIESMISPEPPPAPPAAPPASPADPVVFGEGEPFAVPEPATPPGGYVLAPSTSAEPGVPSAGIVRVGDNQLQLRLQGTGAIAESGQVRALDIEVPVPGSWVGNRRVTLQLRLTLSPVAEDEDGGPGGPS